MWKKKSETNSKSKKSKTQTEKTFEFETFGFVSNFGFRASNLKPSPSVEEFFLQGARFQL